MSRWPSQTSVSELKMYPLGHWQVKLPGVFLHRPLSHSSLFIRHSSISDGQQTQKHGDFPHPGFPLLNFLEELKEQSTYQCSFCLSGLPQILHCRCICTSSTYFHTRHSGRCQGRGHTRWYLRRQRITWWTSQQEKRAWVITTFNLYCFVWSLQALCFNGNKTQMMRSFWLPLPSPVVPMLFGHSARNSAATKHMHLVDGKKEEITASKNYHIHQNPGHFKEKCLTPTHYPYLCFFIKSKCM